MKKKCTKCKQEKDRSEFVRAINTTDGLYAQCRECVNKKTAAYRKKLKTDVIVAF